jgi:hypothetical protein
MKDTVYFTKSGDDEELLCSILCTPNRIQHVDFRCLNHSVSTFPSEKYVIVSSKCSPGIGGVGGHLLNSSIRPAGATSKDVVTLSPMLWLGTVGASSRPA